MELDLRPYGIHLTLVPNMTDVYDRISTDTIELGSFSKSKSLFKFKSGSYDLDYFINKGSYGEAYKATHIKTKEQCVIKVIDADKIRSLHEFRDFVNESVMHIIIYNESKNETYGPFVPCLYEIAYDPDRNNILIRMEALHNQLYQLYNSSTKEENDIFIPQTISFIAYMLKFLGDTLNFNHRDFKSDNVMYIRNSKGDILLRIIDLGFSCMTWNGIHFKGQYFSNKDECFRAGRDITQIMYEIYIRHLDGSINLSKNMVKVFKDILTFKHGKKTCDLTKLKMCGGPVADEWLDIYDLLNRKDIHNPNCTPEKILSIMTKLMGVPLRNTDELPNIHSIMKSARHLTPHCGIDEVFDKSSGKCIPMNSLMGRQILNSQHMRSRSPDLIADKTRKVRRKIPTIKLKPCKFGQTRNPATRRCKTLSRLGSARAAAAAAMAAATTISETRPSAATTISETRPSAATTISETRPSAATTISEARPSAATTISEARPSAATTISEFAPPVRRRPLIPCKPGQFRNPLTRRCKKI
jgi:hypothetical protein